FPPCAPAPLDSTMAAFCFCFQKENEVSTEHPRSSRKVRQSCPFISKFPSFPSQSTVSTKSGREERGSFNSSTRFAWYSAIRFIQLASHKPLRPITCSLRPSCALASSVCGRSYTISSAVLQNQALSTLTKVCESHRQRSTHCHHPNRIHS